MPHLDIVIHFKIPVFADRPAVLQRCRVEFAEDDVHDQIRRWATDWRGRGHLHLRGLAGKIIKSTPYILVKDCELKKCKIQTGRWAAEHFGDAVFQKTKALQSDASNSKVEASNLVDGNQVRRATTLAALKATLDGLYPLPCLAGEQHRLDFACHLWSFELLSKLLSFSNFSSASHRPSNASSADRCTGALSHALCWSMQYQAQLEMLSSSFNAWASLSDVEKKDYSRWVTVPKVAALQSFCGVGCVSHFYATGTRMQYDINAALLDFLLQVWGKQGLPNIHHSFIL